VIENEADALDRVQRWADDAPGGEARVMVEGLGALVNAVIAEKQRLLEWAWCAPVAQFG